MAMKKSIGRTLAHIDVAATVPFAFTKLAHSEFAKIGSRQEALQTIFPSLLDIFYHPIFDFFQKNRLFQQPPLLPTLIVPIATLRWRIAQSPPSAPCFESQYLDSLSRRLLIVRF